MSASQSNEPPSGRVPERRKARDRAGADERPLKILFVSMEYPPETGGGGIGSYVFVQARALAARGHDVHVLSCVRHQESRDYVDAGVHVHRRGKRHLRGSGRIARETAWRLHTAVAAYRSHTRLGIPFDVVETPDWAAEGLLFALRRPAALVAHLHSPLVFIRRGNEGNLRWDDRLASTLERVVVSRADVVTAPSRFIVSELAQAGWLPRSDVRLLPHPVDLELWALSSRETSPRILSVGRLEPRKAPELVVEAALRLRREVPSVEVVFIGRSNYRRNGMPYRDWVAEYARSRGVPCVFVDPVPRHELAAWYASARVVVLSGYDNLPMVGLEAMAARRPLVCSRRTGLAELVQSARAGGTFPERDADELARTLRPLLVSQEVADETGRRARELVEKRCSPSAVSAERERCYREAIRLFQRRA